MILFDGVIVKIVVYKGILHLWLFVIIMFVCMLNWFCLSGRPSKNCLLALIFYQAKLIPVQMPFSLFMGSRYSERKVNNNNNNILYFL